MTEIVEGVTVEKAPTTEERALTSGKNTSEFMVGGIAAAVVAAAAMFGTEISEEQAVSMVKDLAMVWIGGRSLIKTGALVFSRKAA